MANIPLKSDISLQTATDASISNQTFGTQIVGVTWDTAPELSSIVKLRSAFIPENITIISGIQPSEGAASLARGRSTVTRYGQIFPRTVYGN
tara:strand:+ start:412 stop:687 length:276 start_codon:yes stop_codon:yes gene_type:complete